MTWKDINVFQWQQIAQLVADDKEMTELDLNVRLASIVTGLTEHQLDSLPMEDLRTITKSVSFVYEEIKPQPHLYIKVNGKRYKCIYDVRNIPAARYIESKHFGNDVYGNLHKLAACLVMPMKKTWLGWRVDKYDASKHEQYAQDMLEAPITAVLGSVVFFCLFYRTWIKISKDYLIKDMMKKGVTRYQAEAAHRALCSSMDGYIRPHWWQSSNESRLSRLMSFPPFNFSMTSLTSKLNRTTRNSS
jgi:hypothetical protein